MDIQLKSNLSTYLISSMLGNQHPIKKLNGNCFTQLTDMQMDRLMERQKLYTPEHTLYAKGIILRILFCI